MQSHDAAARTEIRRDLPRFATGEAGQQDGIGRKAVIFFALQNLHSAHEQFFGSFRQRRIRHTLLDRSNGCIRQGVCSGISGRIFFIRHGKFSCLNLAF